MYSFCKLRKRIHCVVHRIVLFVFFRGSVAAFCGHFYTVVIYQGTSPNRIIAYPSTVLLLKEGVRRCCKIILLISINHSMFMQLHSRIINQEIWMLVRLEQLLRITTADNFEKNKRGNEAFLRPHIILIPGAQRSLVEL